MPRRVQQLALTALTCVLSVLLCLAEAASGVAVISPTIHDLTGKLAKATTSTDPRPDSITRGSFQTLFDHLPSNEGGFLEQIHHKHGTTTVSKFDYTYTPDGKISTWTKEQGGAVKFMEFVHDLTGQLTKSTTRQTNATGTILQTLAYGYDRAGNRTSRTEDGSPFTANFNARNQLTIGDFLGEIPFIGEMDEWAQVEVTANGQTKPARVRQHESKWLFETSVPLESDGTTQVDIAATDASSNLTSHSYRIDSGSGQWAALTYDDNGNTTARLVTLDSVTTTTTYTWDRENRLETVTKSGITERFVYNASGERVKMIWNFYGIGGIERRFIWTGGHQPSQERNASNQVVANFQPAGEQRWNGTSFDDYFYTRDHLGSIREMMDDTGTIVARYDYSPYGIREAIGTPTIEPVFGFTGHFYHEMSGHWLTLYRAYDPVLGRWLSPDPLGEAGGINLYGYVGNDPINAWDPLGLAPHCDFTGGLTEEGKRSEALANYGKRIAPREGEFSFFGHGFPESVIDTRGQDKDKYAGGMYSPEMLDAYMKKHHKEDWENSKFITLHSCSTGKKAKGFAQRLANLTKKPVLAPTKKLWTDGTIADPKDGVFPSAPDTSEPGSWETFNPK